MNKKMNTRKQSVLLGGLISSAGIFISKFLGLLYVVPFNAILQTSANQSYYAATYNIYTYILNIATAGLPFAIATLIARYESRQDYQTCLLVRKIANYTMATFGLVCCLFTILLATPIASAICPEDGDVSIMRNSIILISFSLFTVSLLSSIRGFYQGLKEMEIYSMSQILEQIARIIFLLTLGAFCVYILHQDAVWALYFSVLAASVSALLTYFYIRWKGNPRLQEVKQLAKIQDVPSHGDAKEIFKELIFVAIPFLLTAIFGYSDTLINQMNLKPAMEVYGQMAYTTDLSSAIFMHATKIIAIPMILAPGFSSAIIPYITAAIEKKNVKLVRKYILDCVDSVIYIAIPICFMMFLYAKPIMFVLFGGSILELDAFVLKWYALEALCGTICPIFSSIVMTLGYRRRIIFHTFCFALTKLLTNYIFICWWGVGGMVLSSFLAYVVVMGLNIYVIQHYYHVNWIYTLRKTFLMLLGVLCVYLISLPFQSLGWINYCDSRIIALFMLGIMGILSCFIYVVVTAILQLPQTIFHFDIQKIIKKFHH